MEQESKMTDWTAELVEDREHPGSFRVEAFDDEGGCHIAIFHGPNAKDQAICHAGSDYFDGWHDPEGHGLEWVMAKDLPARSDPRPPKAPSHDRRSRA